MRIPALVGPLLAVGGCQLLWPVGDYAGEPAGSSDASVNGGAGGAGTGGGAGSDASAAGAGGSLGGAAGNVSSGRLADSETVFCTDGTQAAPCPAPGALLHGQDGNYLIDVPSYSGDSVSAVESVTTLEFEVSGASYLTYAAAVDRCNNLTKAGHDDWRLPSVLELLTVADFGASGLFINGGVFPLVVAENYRASELAPGDGGPAGEWAFQFGTGVMGDGLPGGSVRSFCVRGPQLYSGTWDTSDPDVAVDGRTGLYWQRKSNPNSEWAAALATCRALVDTKLGGYADWRLPSIKELLSIVDRSKKIQPWIRSLSPTRYPSVSGPPHQIQKTRPRCFSFT